MTPQTLYLVWGISIVLLLVVTAVVAWLLAGILKTARNILGVAGEIWTTGKLVANNTVHIPLLNTTNRYVGKILETAQGIVAGAGAIEQHAQACPGCPDCALSQAEPAGPGLTDLVSGVVDRVRKRLGT